MIFRDDIGCLPAALALRTAGRCDAVDTLSSGSVDSHSALPCGCSGIGETVLSCVELRVAAVGAVSFDEDCTAEFGNNCELSFLFNACLPAGDAFSGADTALAAGGDSVDIAISKPVIAVLPDEGMSLSLPPSSSDSGGDANRAVGFGPEDNGFLDFFKIGCDGGGFEALDDRLLMEVSLDFIRGGSGRCLVSSRPR